MNKDRLYFAYGSNINLDQMAFRCPAAKPLMPVVLHGYELTFRGGGVATVIPKENSTVLGLMWKLSPECEQSLDRYEGYPSYYHKTDAAVTDPETGKIYYTMMYEMDERYRETELPSPMYFTGIIEGYAQNNMDTRPLIDALKRTARECEARQEWDLFPSCDRTGQNRKKPHKNRQNER